MNNVFKIIKKKMIEISYLCEKYCQPNLKATPDITGFRCWNEGLSLVIMMAFTDNG